jgi:hypothetical protein
MKKLFLGIAVVLALGMMASVVMAGVGNTIPKGLRGEHYTLNIIALEFKEDAEKAKAASDNMGHVIFVPLWRKCKIIMTQDPQYGEFKVVDRDGSDGVAHLNIAPADEDSTGHYSVFAAALGKPNREVTITSWGEFEDALDPSGKVLLELGTVSIPRLTGKGNPKSVNINELFYVDVTLCLEAGPDPNDPQQIICLVEVVYQDYWVFDIAELLGYYWDYDNTLGLKHLQVRFYPCTLDCTGTAPDYCRWGTTSDAFPDGDPICSMKDGQVISDPVPSGKRAPAVTNNVTTTWGDIKE